MYLGNEIFSLNLSIGGGPKLPQPRLWTGVYQAVRPGFNGGSGGGNIRGNGGGSSGQLFGRAPAAARHLLSLRGTQLLVALPILLAAFALGLQVHARSDPHLGIVQSDGELRSPTLNPIFFLP